MSPEEGRKLLDLKNAVVTNFTAEHWLELGALTGWLDAIRHHDRLLRSLSWQDSDYGTHAFTMLTNMVQSNSSNLQVIDDFVTERFPAGGSNVSSVERPGKRIYFTPSVFEIPSAETEPDLLSIMMPFSADFAPIHLAVVEAARRNGMRAQRANDIWIHSTVIQDISP